MKRSLRKVAVLMAAILVCMQCSFVSFAYFERGNVTVKAGKQSVSLEPGASENISVSFTPSSSSQLPGCGMAECPQSCGEKECLDENGECTCNGRTYKTYYAYASATSSNTSVATAKYDNGVVTIKGVGAGTATVTLTASLRQYTSTSTTIQVTVEKKSSSGNGGSSSGGGSSSSGNGGSSSGSGSSSSGNSGSSSGGGSSSSGNHGSSSGNGSTSSGNGSSSSGNSGSSSGNSGSSSGNSGSGVTAKSVNGNQDTSGTNQKEEKDGLSPEEEVDLPEEVEDEDISVIESDRGKIIFVPIIDGKQGKEQFEEIKGQEAYVDFQLKDQAGTVLYAWEFYGKDLTSTEDIDLFIESSTNAFDGCSYGSSSDSLYLALAHKEKLPGKASVFMRVNEQFSDEQALNLYAYNEEDDTVTLIEEGLKIENGYVTMNLEDGGNYILTTQTLENTVPDEDTDESDQEEPVSDSRGWVVVVVVVVIVAAAACAGFVVVKKKKGNKE